MAPLDLALLILFGTLSILGLTASVVCFLKALKVSGHRDGELKMFFWAVGAMTGLIIAGVSVAYILLPILFPVR
jgi:hypothetical protein